LPGATARSSPRTVPAPGAADALPLVPAPGRGAVGGEAGFAPTWSAIQKRRHGNGYAVDYGFGFPWPRLSAFQSGTTRMQDHSGGTMKRRHLTRLLTLSALAAAAVPWAGSASAQAKEVTIAHQDMMVPWRYAHAMKEVEKATGYKINYRKFTGGGDVIRAMASGQVHVGEAGSAPIAAALSQGLPVQLFWILDDIGSAEVLVARNGSGIEKLEDLKGKKIGVPFTSTTHFHTMVALEMAKIQPNAVRLLNMRPPEVAAAWERGDIDATFIWEPVLSRVKGSGK